MNSLGFLPTASAIATGYPDMVNPPGRIGAACSSILKFRSFFERSTRGRFGHWSGTQGFIMARETARKIGLVETAQLTVRMLIASYFMAASVGSVPGASTGALLAPLMDDPLGRAIGGSIVFTLATMVLLGVQTRIAALGLGLITFYASYLHIVQIGDQPALGAFWRDMALVAMLMLTYGNTAKAPAPPVRASFTIRRVARRAERARQMGAPHQPIAALMHVEPDASRVPAAAEDAPAAPHT
jgi:uncharacterized membrane protein YphA (DoxX/SURF4 family)